MTTRYAGRILLAAIVATVSVLAIAAIGEKKAKGPFAESGADVVALAEAAKEADCDLIDKLVARKVNVNAQGKGGITPLIYCAQAENAKGFERLLVHGADPNLRDDSRIRGHPLCSGLAREGDRSS